MDDDRRPINRGAPVRSPGGLIAASYLVGLADPQQAEHLPMSTFPLKAIDLRLVVVVDEGFDSPDRVMVGVAAPERRREPEQPAS
jgi:hypothetical protein